MANDFIGSIAQNYISFSAVISESTVPGDNYYKVMLFIGAAESAANLTVPLTTGSTITLTKASYLTDTIGPLLVKMTDFYANNSVTEVIVVAFDDSTVTTGTFGGAAVTALTTQFNLHHAKAFFKLMTLSNNIPANSALATLCFADTLLSQCWIGANDAQMIVPGSTTSMYGVCHLAGSDPVIVYHPDATQNGALVQLGLSLAVLNSTGTPVGNSMDYLATDAITPSGTAGANPSSTVISTLDGINSGFFLTIGNGTGKVANKGGKTILGNLAGAGWVTQYINYVCSVQTAEYLTQYNKFKNNSTYQAILSFVRYQLSAFSDTGRLSEAKITAPSYSNLPPAAGDTITVPDAWEAYYNDNVRKVNIQGTLYISQS